MQTHWLAVPRYPIAANRLRSFHRTSDQSKCARLT
jgi:hypothetical protein